MTGGTDQDHLAVLELVVRGLADCLPPGPVVQYDCLTQLVHREYVFMGIEKHQENTIWTMARFDADIVERLLTLLAER